MTQPLRTWLLAIVSVLLVGCDHSTKLVAEQHLRRSTISLIPDVLDLRYAQNHDVAFSVLRVLQLPVRPALLVSLSLLMLVAIFSLWWSHRRLLTSVDHVGFALIVSGAIANALDRLVRGYVVDFIHVHYWPIFNVADIGVTIGLGLLMLGRLRRRRAGGFDVEEGRH